MKKLNYNPFSDDVPVKNAQAFEGALEEKTAVDELDEGPEKATTIPIPAYGGVVVTGADSGTEAILKILNFLVDHRATLDACLTHYDVILMQLDEFPKDGFCVRRTTDGWTLCVPFATDRTQALLQIVQVLLEVAKGPLSTALRAAQITPYRE